MKDREQDDTIADVIIERPKPLTIGKNRLYLYPPSLGVTMLTQRLMKAIEPREDILEKLPFLEYLRMVREQRERVQRIIAYRTCRTRDELFNEELIRRRMRMVGSLKDEDIAGLLIVALTDARVAELTKKLGIDKEREYQRRVQSVKNDRNSMTFGGASIYGSLIDVACERYGWTYDYVVWGISYANLQLMLADRVVDVYLTDAERKRVRVPKGRKNVINADDPKNLALIRALL